MVQEGGGGGVAGAGDTPPLSQNGPKMEPKETRKNTQNGKQSERSTQQRFPQHA